MTPKGEQTKPYVTEGTKLSWFPVLDALGVRFGIWMIGKEEVKAMIDYPLHFLSFHPTSPSLAASRPFSCLFPS